MKKIIALGVVVFGLVALYGLAWLWAAGQATAYVKSLETADGVDAPRVVCSNFAISGFPFGFDANCEGATVETGDVTITLGGLKAAVEVYRPTHVLFFAQSPASISDAFTGSSGRIDFVRGQASVRLDNWRIGRASLVIDEPRLTDTVLEDRPLANATRLEAHLIDQPGKHDASKGLASLAQYVKIDGLDAPGWQVARGEAQLEAEITNLPDDMRVYGDADLLRRWQDAGGRFVLTGLKGGDSVGSFEASGTLGLDSAGRAEGQLKLHSNGIVERLAPLFPPDYQGWIVGTQAADGSYSQTLNIAAGVVFSGLVPTGIIPPLL